MTRRQLLAGAALLIVPGRLALGESAPALAYVALVASPIACGRLLAIDVAAARALPGVLGVVSSGDAPAAGTIDYVGQPLALVVATSAATADAAARLCKVTYQSQPALLTIAAALGTAHAPAPSAVPLLLNDAGRRAAVAYERGKPEAAAELPDVLVRQTYHTAPEWAATWALTVTATAGSGGTRWELRPPLLGPVAEQPPPALLTRLVTLAMRSLPLNLRTAGVELALSAEPAQTLAGRRPETIQTLSLGANRDGRLRTLRHSSLSDTAMAQSLEPEYVEPCALLSQSLYDVDTVQTSHQVVRRNIAPSAALPAAGFAPGLFALEGALNELAYLLKLDPVQLRLLNYAELDRVTGRPYVGKQLRECYRLGMERIGWSEPGGPRDGERLVGLGMASTMGLPIAMPFGATCCPFGAHFVRLFVEPGTGRVELGQLVTVLDAGPLSDRAAAQQIVQAAIQYALKVALAEEPAGRQPPELTVLFVESEPPLPPTTRPPLTAAALRDLAVAGLAPALASALHNATGRFCRELPLRPAHQSS